MCSSDRLPFIYPSLQAHKNIRTPCFPSSLITSLPVSIPSSVHSFIHSSVLSLSHYTFILFLQVFFLPFSSYPIAYFLIMYLFLVFSRKATTNLSKVEHSTSKTDRSVSTFRTFLLSFVSLFLFVLNLSKVRGSTRLLSMHLQLANLQAGRSSASIPFPDP